MTWKDRGGEGAGDMRAETESPTKRRGRAREKRRERWERLKQ